MKTFWAELGNRPGTAPLMRSVGDSLKIRTKGFFT